MEKIRTPYYIVYENRLRKNLEIIKHVSTEANVEIIMAFKANALWKTFPIIREYINASTASSLNEMQLSLDFLKGEVHTYCPVYTEDTIREFLHGSTHMTFNSINHFNKFKNTIADYNSQSHKKVSIGLRVNPQCSVIETDIYNPCLPGSRFGVTAEMIGENLPKGIDGLHFHALCESTSYDLEKVLIAFKQQYGKYLDKLKWINMGGGHLMTKNGYDITHLITLLNDFHREFPHLKLIMEPGSAFTWRTGDLITEILDIVENQGIKTAIIDASFACHMPDCLEMPYQPVISEALPLNSSEGIPYRLGGNSCLSGDFVGDWHFQNPLKPGMRLTLEDMNHYTTVKTNMFNGIQHPAIWFEHSNGQRECLRKFTYEDYRDRMD